MTVMEQIATNDQPLLKVDGLTKRYGPRIGCADVSFDLYPGEVLGIVGESGSGKSTLLSCLAGHQRPDLGRIAYDGRDVLTMSETDRRSGCRAPIGPMSTRTRATGCGWASAQAATSASA